ncbi:transcriptional regulator [Nocardia carnea]|uniref:transcriptional regulator n=1 Tax=Nocardia carnea TaxID=37328 RepID=UPI0024546787|nr:transcriptional regulator [Nocardia carnea]
MGSKAAGSGSADLEAELVAYFRDSDPDSHADLVTTVRHCLAAAAQNLGSRPAAAPTAIIAAAARWAREGVALETVLTACHDCARGGFDFLATRVAAAAAQAEAMADAARLLVRVVEVVTTAAATAYLDEHRIVAREHQTAAQTLVAALLSGHGVSALARRSGLRIAPAYQVVALAIPPNAEERGGGPDAVSAGRRKLRRVQAALGPALGSRSLSLLNADGGTVLIPLESVRATGSARAAAGLMSAEVLQLVAEAAEVAPIATVAAGTTDQVPELAGRTHDVLDRLRDGGRPPGLYRIDEGSALEPDAVVVEAIRLRRLPRVPTRPAARRGKPGAA